MNRDAKKYAVYWVDEAVSKRKDNNRKDTRTQSKDRWKRKDERK